MKQILLTTHNNKAKLKKLKQGIQSFMEVKILSLNDINVKTSPHETDKTFEENSRLKAQFYGNLTGLLTIADDGGFISLHYTMNPKCNRGLLADVFVFL